MQVLLNKRIDLSNYQSKDLLLDGLYAEMVNVQCDGLNGAVVTVEGKLINADDFTPLAVINNANFELSQQINVDGLFSIDVTGIDMIRFVLSEGANTGVLSIKVVK